MASFSKDNLAIGRVISEDGRFMLLEVMKDESQSFHLDPAQENNRFYALLFVQFHDDAAMTFKKPWE